MRQVGRELEGEQAVVKLEVLADVLPHRCVASQFQQAAVVLGEAQFAGRAQHAVAVDTAQLAHLDQEGFAVFARGQFGPHQGARHLDAHTGVGRAADDLQQLARACVHLAHAQTVGVGVLFGFNNGAHHDLGERRRHGHALLHLQTGHGQGVGQLLAGQGRVAECTQPGLGELHVSDSRNALADQRNWLRKRMSPSKNRRRSLTP